MAAKPHRHWFRFSLRTLFVLVTLPAIPLGFVCQQSLLVRRRAVMIDWLRQQDNVNINYAPITNLHYSPKVFHSVRDWEAIRVQAGDKENYPGLFRLWLGDEDIAILALGPDQRPSDYSCDRIGALFPEAEIFSMREEDRTLSNR